MADGVAEIGLREALQTVAIASGMGQTSDDSLIAAVAGALDAILSRRSLYAARSTRDGEAAFDALYAAAAVFVHDVWRGALAEVVPSAKKRRIAFAIYRVSFERAARILSKTRTAET